MATLTESAAHSKSRLALSVRFATIVYFSCLVCISEPRSVCGPPTDHLVKYAVVTMVGGSPGYIVGANVLLYSMLGTMDRGVRRHTQFIVLVTNHKTPAEKKTLSPLWTVCEPPLIGNASSKTVMFEKLWVYQLLDYERVLFLDADTFAVGDVSPLLTTPGLGAIAVTPDWFENVVPKPGTRLLFNTGVFSVKPDHEEFFRINKFRLEQPSIDNEQTLLNQYYGDAASVYFGNHTSVTWFNFSYNAWLNGLSPDGRQPSRGNWDMLWMAYRPSLVVHHLIGHLPPDRPELNASDERSAVYRRWWEFESQQQRCTP